MSSPLWLFLALAAPLAGCAQGGTARAVDDGRRSEAQRTAESARAGGAPSAEGPAPLDVWVRGLRSAEGRVLVLLFDGAEGFPGQPERAVAEATVGLDTARWAGDSVRVRFAGRVPGTYALSAVHDENGNGVLDTGPLGIPREGYGASNDARRPFAPPRYEDAAVAWRPGRPLRVTVGY
jgi:uncharacterized protein (DUF2141 family)